MQRFHRVRLVEADLEGQDVEVSEGLLATDDLEAVPPVLRWRDRAFVLAVRDLEEPDPNPPAADATEPTNAGALSSTVRLYRADGTVDASGAPEFVIEMPLRTS